jgi:hypothetical protein
MCELLPLEILQQQRQRAVEDDSRISVRYLVSQKVLCSAKLVVRLSAHRHLYFVALRSERSDHGPTAWRARHRLFNSSERLDLRKRLSIGERGE